MIQPTNGRVVLFHPAQHFQGRQLDPSQPLAAMVVHVENERRVNLVVFDSSGHACSAPGVQLLQDDDTATEQSWAEWMPYQKGQAAKTEAAEAAGKSAS